MTSPPPPAPEIRGRLRAVWDRLSRRQLFDAGELLAPLPAAEPAVRNARAVWHLSMRETDAALELLRPLALLPDEISLDPGADIAWRANFVLALLKAGNRDGFEHNLKRLDAPDHPGVAAMRRLLEEAEKSRGLFSRWFGSAPMPELPSEFPVGWPEDWLAAEPSPPREIPASALPQPRPSASPAPVSLPRPVPEIAESQTNSPPASPVISHQEPLSCAQNIDEDVKFTVYRPQTMMPEEWCQWLVFAHRSPLSNDEPDFDEEVRNRAKTVLGKNFAHYEQEQNRSSAALPHESTITVVPQVDGVRFNPPHRTFLWMEPVHQEDFRAKADACHDGRTLRGRVTFYLGALVIAEVNVVVLIGKGASNRKQVPDSARAFRKIFASYSRLDLQIVEHIEAVGAGLGDRYLRDLRDIRSGEVWSERLEQMIEEADIFQLFWSSNSMQSQHVRQEWEYALALGRRRFIRPTYWETPFPKDESAGNPPETLSSLHFEHIPSILHGSVPSKKSSERNGTNGESGADPKQEAPAHKEQSAFEQVATEEQMPADKPMDAEEQMTSEDQWPDYEPMDARNQQSGYEQMPADQPMDAEEQIASEDQRPGCEPMDTEDRLSGYERMPTEEQRAVDDLLAIGEQSGGADHPDVARDLNNMVELLYATNRLAEAESLNRSALAIWEASLGKDHPLVATALNSLAQLLQATIRLSEAEPLYLRALKIREASFGPDHPDTIRSLEALADFLDRTERFDEVAPLRRRALEAKKRTLGPDHPNTLRGWNNLSVALRKQGKPSEAESIDRMIVETTTNLLGTTHPLTLHRRNNLVLSLILLGQLVESRVLLSLNSMADTTPHENLTPRFPLLQWLVELLAGETSKATVFLGRLKTHFARQPVPIFANIQVPWDLAYFIDALRPKLGPENTELFIAIVAVLNARTAPTASVVPGSPPSDLSSMLVALDAFPAWREAEPRPLD